MNRQRMPMLIRTFMLFVMLGSQWAIAQSSGNGQIEAHLFSLRRHVNNGEPVSVEFRIQNVSDEPVILFVPGTEPAVIEESVMGLPLAHVFSGQAFGGLMIRNEAGRSWNVAVGYQPPAKAPMATLGPHATIGVTLDVREFYPALRASGTYRLTWAPYGGSVTSNTLVIRVAPLKKAVIVTDKGEMTVRLFYEETPNHVENFLELAKDGFYNNLTFHRIERGFYIQGGCPMGDGRGIRPDGHKLEAEFTNRPQTRGSVSMARVEGDPDSASCQFFITHTRVPEWDGRYTIFGELVGEESFSTLDRLMSQPIDTQGRPRQRISIRAVRVVDAPMDAQ